MGFPTTALVVILDNKPEAVFEIKFDREERALVIYVISCLVSYCFVCGGLEELLGDVAASPSIEG